MIEFSDLQIGFKGKPLMRGRLQVHSTGLHWIRGPNGSGKTTLLKELAQQFLILRPDLRGRLGFVSSLHSYERNIPLTGQEFFRLYGSEPLPGLVGIYTQLREKFISEMSSGEFQALVLIAVLSSSNEIYFFDEPFSHLSQVWSGIFSQAIFDVSSRKPVLLVSHQDLHFEMNEKQGNFNSQDTFSLFEIRDQKLVTVAEHA